MMEIDREDRGDVVVVRVVGTLDLYESDRFKDLMDHLIDDEGCGKVVMDCSSMNYIDSSGLGILVDSLRKIRANGGDLRLAGLQERVHNVLKLTKVEKLFKIYGSVDGAMRSF
ncbi:MAG: STAS domain-containing protein [bacterium]